MTPEEQEYPGRGNRTNHPHKSIAKRDFVWRSVHIDEYTHDLVIRAVNENRGKSKVQVINKGLCLLLDIPYKTDEQLLAERELEAAQKLVNAYHVKSREERKAELVKELKSIEVEEQKQPAKITNADIELLRQAQLALEERRKKLESE